MLEGENSKTGHSADFELVRMGNRVKMITFVKRSGASYSASYSHLHGVYLIAGGLRLEFSKCQVIVQGANLVQVHHAIADYRVVLLRESKESISQDADALNIAKITFSNYSSGRF